MARFNFKVEDRIKKLTYINSLTLFVVISLFILVKVYVVPDSDADEIPDTIDKCLNQK